MFNRQYLPNLNSLRIFEAAGRHLSFKAAAEELFVTPSAVSQQIKNLESQLGVTLFKRNNRALALTQIGEDYWKQVHQSIRGIHEYTSALMKANQEELRVSLMPPVANRVVLPKLNDFHQHHAHINLRLDSSQKVRKVSQGEVDIAVRFGKPPWKGVAYTKLCDLYIRVICPLGFSQKFQLKDRPQNMKEVPLIQMSQSPEAWQRWFTEMSIEAPTGKQHILDNYPSAIQAAESIGAMLALIPIENELIRSQRVEAPFEALGPIEEGIYAVYNKDSSKLESILLFTNWLKRQITNLEND